MCTIFITFDIHGVGNSDARCEEVLMKFGSSSILASSSQNHSLAPPATLTEFDICLQTIQNFDNCAISVRSGYFQRDDFSVFS